MAAPRTSGFLYTSKLAAGADPGVVATITQDARGRNAVEGISGVLAFDGAWFAQLVEGPEPAIASLHARLARDRRHVDVTTLWRGDVAGARRFPNWRLGFLPIGARGGSDLSALGKLRDAAAVEAFCRITAHLDVGSGLADVVRPSRGS